MKLVKVIAIQIVVMFVIVVVGLSVTEFVLRLKNSSMQNYDIEMWRYAKTLKVKSENPNMGHEHLPNKSEVLQSVEVRTNSYGMRGPEPKDRASVQRRILFLGSSITMGWGVAEDKTFARQVQDLLNGPTGTGVETLNAGIGNYNAHRYVELFFTKLKPVQPSDIVVAFFLRDAESLTGTANDNWFLRNSELAAISWMAFQHRFGSVGSKTLEDHYKEVFDQNSPGFKDMKAALAKLSSYSQEQHIRLYLAMIPDVHNLKNYPFGYAHDEMHKVATELNYRFLDLYPALSKLDPQEVWAMPGDPHPNALGHTIMAKEMAPWLALQDNKI